MRFVTEHDPFIMHQSRETLEYQVWQQMVISSKESWRGYLPVCQHGLLEISSLVSSRDRIYKFIKWQMAWYLFTMLVNVVFPLRDAKMAQTKHMQTLEIYENRRENGSILHINWWATTFSELSTALLIQRLWGPSNLPSSPHTEFWLFQGNHPEHGQKFRLVNQYS